jgi:hypothetical protein
MRRPPLAAALALALLPVAPASSQVQAIVPTFQLDAKKDVKGPLDIVRTAMSTREDGSLRADLTLRRPWATADVGAGGSLCMKLYVKADPDGDVPEYLVCATPPAQGTALTGRLLRNRANGLPRTVAPVLVSRPDTRTLYLSFAPKAIRSPATLRFAGETVWRGAGCPPVAGCVDLGPNPPGARDFRLHRDTASG